MVEITGCVTSNCDLWYSKYSNVSDHTRKNFHISLSQENKFSFEGESEHFKSHIVSKNVELSKIDNYFIIMKLLTFMLPFLWNVGLKAYFFHIFSLVQLKTAGWWHFITWKAIYSYFFNFEEIFFPRSWNCPFQKLRIFGHKM